MSVFGKKEKKVPLAAKAREKLAVDQTILEDLVWIFDNRDERWPMLFSPRASATMRMACAVTAAGIATQLEEEDAQ